MTSVIELNTRCLILGVIDATAWQIKALKSSVCECVIDATYVLNRMRAKTIGYFQTYILKCMRN